MESLNAFHVSTLQAKLAARRPLFHAFRLASAGLCVRNDFNVRLAEGSARTQRFISRPRNAARRQSARRRPYRSERDQSRAVQRDPRRAGHRGIQWQDPGPGRRPKDRRKTDKQELDPVRRCRSEHATELEIFADDVRCTHGATIGQLDRERCSTCGPAGSNGTKPAMLIYAFARTSSSRLKCPRCEHRSKRMLSRRTAGAQPCPRLDVERIREDFPVLKQQVHGKPLVYLDNAATARSRRR